MTCEFMPFLLLLTGSGSLVSLTIGPMAMKMARIVPALSTMPTGMTFTAQTASVSSVNVPLTVSTLYSSELFMIYCRDFRCACLT